MRIRLRPVVQNTNEKKSYAPDPPTGIVTFLFTDIVDSTLLWERFPAAMKCAIERHDVLVRHIIEAQEGFIFKTVGDAFCAAFADVVNALIATIKIQYAIRAENWGVVGPLRVRTALHTGSAEVNEGDYKGRAVNFVSRLSGTGHGGQILLSRYTIDLVRDILPDSTELRDLGEFSLKGIRLPERIFQLNVAGLPTDFPPLRVSNQKRRIPRKLAFVSLMPAVASLLVYRLGLASNWDSSNWGLFLLVATVGSAFLQTAQGIVTNLVSGAQVDNHGDASGTAGIDWHRLATLLINLTISAAIMLGTVVLVNGNVSRKGSRPICVINASNISGVVPLLVSFSSASYDPDGGAIESHFWQTQNQSAFGRAAQFEFDQPGVHKVMLVVQDDEGDSETCALTIRTKEAPKTSENSVQESTAATQTTTIEQVLAATTQIPMVSAPVLSPVLTSTAVPSPNIRFWVEETHIDLGQCTGLHWRVDNALSVRLNGEQVDEYFSQTICPQTTTEYALDVIQFDGRVGTRHVYVEVVSPHDLPASATPTPIPPTHTTAPPTQTATPELVSVTPSPTDTPQPTPTNSLAMTPTHTPTATPTCTSTATPNRTPIMTPAQLPTATPMPTHTPSVTPTQAPSAVPTSTPTQTPTSTPTMTATNTLTATPTATPTDMPTETPTPTPTATCTYSQQPIDVVLVLDRSGSMLGQPLADAKQAAKSFVDVMQLSADQVGLVSFSTHAWLDQQLTHQADLVKQAIDALSANGLTNLAEGITTTQQELVSSRHNPAARPVIILLSDGQPTTGGDALAAAQAAKQAGTRIITIGLGYDVDDDLMRAIASTEADYHLVPTSADLLAIYLEIAGGLHCATPTPTLTPTDTPTTTPTPTATLTDTPTPTATNTPVPPSSTPTPTPTPTASNTPVPPSSTPTLTPIPTVSNTSMPPSSTPTLTPIASNTPVPPSSTSTTSPTPTATRTCTAIQRGTLGNVADAYIWSANPNYNGGSSSSLYTGWVYNGEKRSLIRFDLSVIPAGSVIDSADLHIYVTTANDQSVRVHRITSPWTEYGVTWNNFGNGFAPDIEASFVGGSIGFHQADVSALIQAWVNGLINYGLLLEENLDSYHSYQSSEYSVVQFRPCLTVCYR